MSTTNARENLLDAIGFADAMNLGSEPEWLIDAYRAEIMAEFVAWLVKKAREHRAQGPQYAKQADVIGRLASQVQRGAVRPNNLMTLPPQGGPEDVPALRARVAELEESARKAIEPVERLALAFENTGEPDIGRQIRAAIKAGAATT